MTKNSVISITLLTLMSVLTAFNAHAARQVGKITGVIPYEASGKKIVIFKIENNIAQGCNVTGRFAFDESKKNFDLMSSALLSAFHAGTTVHVEYSNSCKAWGNSYDIQHICFGDIPC
ncbi:hypothetical protein ACUULL_001468 [Vibrio cholerae]|uniref:hypothetical protein n=1 Tax=Vibrio TaxID=662 RepID=UPI0009B38935|nr:MULTISPECIES: hypothetical protein [Vibrio]EGQ7703135.1 hypothetical protein [Vibrio cholerae]EGQ8474114.1 hypothetical protein [Vibrio cholerae]EGQ9394790.1 hypothetical protein [Vibrio cholerae]EGR0141185.1 hypothetical protein [Vibrio cholerae]EGR0941683.1 hypothetical protein [Vibrio cholerae]